MPEGSEFSRSGQHQAWRLVLSAALIVSVVVILFVAAMDRAGHLSAGLMLADTRAVGKLPVSAGFLSDIGVLIWWSSACVCLFTAITLGVRWGRGSIGTATYFLTSGLVSAVLALDDALLLHERVFPAVFGVDQQTVYGVYVLGILLWLSVFRRRLLAFLPIWLLLALACFAASVGFDLLPVAWRPVGDLHAVFEDGLKWVGIVLWSTRFWCECLQALVQAMPTTQRSRSE